MLILIAEFISDSELETDSELGTDSESEDEDNGDDCDLSDNNTEEVIGDNSFEDSMDEDSSHTFDS